MGTDASRFADLYPFAIYPDNIGAMFGIQSLGLAYNAKVFQDKGWAPPAPWHDLWDPKYKGHVVVYDLPSGYANKTGRDWPDRFLSGA